MSNISLLKNLTFFVVILLNIFVFIDEVKAKSKLPKCKVQNTEIITTKSNSVLR